MNLTVIGAGYVGLVSGACFAQVGHKVICIDIDESKIENLRNGNVPLFEPGLDSMIRENSLRGRIDFDTKLENGVIHGEVLFIAVGTPPDEDGSADLSYVCKVAEGIGKYMDGNKLIVVKSTVPVGTHGVITEIIDNKLKSRGLQFDFDVVSNPEFLKEGNAVEDFMKPDRIIVGAKNQNAVNIMRRLYAPFNRNHDGFVVMDPASSELTKYAANVMLATKISLMNEFANIAEATGADIERVRIGIGSDPRIGYNFIYPGCGYGGSCFPKDVRALANIASECNLDAPLIKAVEIVNENQKHLLFNKLSSEFGHDLKDRTIAVWGLAFKPKTNDMRDAPSRNLMESIWGNGGLVRAYDPEAMSEARRIYGSRDDLLFGDDQYDVLKAADALVVCTEWQTFRSPDFNLMRELLNSPIVIDGRNLYDPIQMSELGFKYQSFGRLSVSAKPSND